MTSAARAHSIAAPARARARGRQDPLTFILGDGERWELLSICLAVAVSLHGFMVGYAIVSGLLHDMRVAMDEGRAHIHDFLWRQYDVEVDKPKVEEKPEPPPPEAPPEPVPVPKQQVVPKQKEEDDPYKNLPPKPSEAVKIIAPEAKPDEPRSLDGIVSGEGSAVGGMQSQAGKGDTIVNQKSASLNGVQGGKGTSSATPVAPPPPGPDLSKAPGLLGALNWGASCPFPAEADSDDINQGMATLVVTVRADGSPLSVSVTGDSGHGFGRQARICALSKRYSPGLDRSGQPITMTTPPFTVRFNR
jgi:protein TonB